MFLVRVCVNIKDFFKVYKLFFFKSVLHGSLPSLGQNGQLGKFPPIQMAIGSCQQNLNDECVTTFCALFQQKCFGIDLCNYDVIHGYKTNN